MNEHQRLFLVQARSGFAVFELLRKQPAVASGHPLHYLQIATEMFGKVHAWKTGPRGRLDRLPATPADGDPYLFSMGVILDLRAGLMHGRDPCGKRHDLIDRVDRDDA